MLRLIELKIVFIVILHKKARSYKTWAVSIGLNSFRLNTLGGKIVLGWIV